MTTAKPSGSLVGMTVTAKQQQGVADLRRRVGISQEELAARATARARQSDPTAGVSLSTVRRLELGKGVNADHLSPIAVELKVTVDVLLEAMRFERARRAGRAA